MVASPHVFLTPDEYLELEAQAAAKHEYIDGEAYAMAEPDFISVLCLTP